MTDLSNVLQNQSKRKSHSFSISADLLNWLRETAEDSGVSQSEIVNRAVRLFARVHDPKNKDMDGAIMIQALVAEMKDEHDQDPGENLDQRGCLAGYSQYHPGNCNRRIEGGTCSFANEHGCPYQDDWEVA